MPIEWMRTCDYFVDFDPTNTDFVAVDGDEIIGRIIQSDSGPAVGAWTWSVNCVVPGALIEPHGGIEAEHSDAVRRVVQAYTASMVRATGHPTESESRSRSRPRRVQ